MQKILYTTLLLLGCKQFIFAQLLTDKQAQDKIITGLNALYNLDYETAERHFTQLSPRYTGHPVNDLLKAFILQWKYLPIEQHPIALEQYIKHLETCRQKAEKLAAVPDYKAEATFFLLAANGYIALSYNYRKEYTKAVMDAGQAYSYLKDGFKFIGQNVEFNFTTGMYNYYRVQYPETHPIIKPLVVFFQTGNKATGLSQLRKAANSAVFSRIEATNYLVNIYIKYEMNFDQASYFAQRLSLRYPKNHIFKIKYTEALLWNNDFTKATQVVKNMTHQSDKISMLSRNFFEGYIAEKSSENDELALQKYTKAVSYPLNSRYTQEYYAMAYLGMGRIMSRKGETVKATLFYKKCLEYAEYKWVVSEAKQRLRG